MGLHAGRAASPAAALLLLLAAVSSVGRRQTVEEVTKKQLEAYVAEEDYLAVYWCKSTPHTHSFCPNGIIKGRVSTYTQC